jgi:hypothetical protein
MLQVREQLLVFEHAQLLAAILAEEGQAIPGEREGGQAGLTALALADIDLAPEYLARVFASQLVLGRQHAVRKDQHVVAACQMAVDHRPSQLQPDMRPEGVQAAVVPGVLKAFDLLLHVGLPSNPQQLFYAYLFVAYTID